MLSSHATLSSLLEKNASALSTLYQPETKEPPIAAEKITLAQLDSWLREEISSQFQMDKPDYFAIDTSGKPVKELPASSDDEYILIEKQSDEDQLNEKYSDVNQLIEKMVSEFKNKCSTAAPTADAALIESYALNFKKVLEQISNEESFVMVDQEAPKYITGESYTYAKMKFYGQKALLALIAVIASGPTSINAACLGLFPVEELGSKLSTLSAGTLALSATCFSSSLFINSYLSYHLIPNAFRMFYEEMQPKKFTQHLVRNSALLLFATGAGTAAAAIGFSSFLSFGTGWAAFNAAANGFIFWVTRFFGLVNALNRFKKQSTHNYESGGRTFVDLLSHCTEECEEKLNQYLKDNKCELNEKTVIELLKELDVQLLDDPSLVTDKTWKERLKETLNLLAATAGALSVAGVFGEKFATGATKMGIPIDNIPTELRALVCMFFGIATPILYFGQILQLGEVLGDAWSAIFDEHLSRGQQAWNAIKAALLLVFNGFASVSLYTLADGVIKQPDYFLKMLTPEGSAAAEIQKIAADIAGGAVNAKLTIAPALPAPKKHHEHEHKATEEELDADDPVFPHARSSTALTNLELTAPLIADTSKPKEPKEPKHITNVQEVRDYLWHHTLPAMNEEEVLTHHRQEANLKKLKRELDKTPEPAKQVQYETLHTQHAEQQEKLQKKYESSLNSLHNNHWTLLYNDIRNKPRAPAQDDLDESFLKVIEPS